MICKLHSARVNSPTMPTYKDYQVCVKEDASQTRRCQAVGQICNEATRGGGEGRKLGDCCDDQHNKCMDRDGPFCNNQRKCESCSSHDQCSHIAKPFDKYCVITLSGDSTSLSWYNTCAECRNSADCKDPKFKKCNYASKRCDVCNSEDNDGCDTNNPFCVLDIWSPNIVGVYKCMKCKEDKHCNQRDKSVCIQNKCEPCSNHDQCSHFAPFNKCKSDTKKCERCDPQGNEGCDATTNPYCVMEPSGDYKCAVCDPQDKSSCDTKTPYCVMEISGDYKCAECKNSVSRDCTDPAKSKCLGNECKPCQNPQDCTHITDKSKCKVEPNQPKVCVCAPGTDCKPHNQNLIGKIDPEYLFCKPIGKKCGYTAFLQCELFWFADGTVDNQGPLAGPELRIEVFPSSTSNQPLKQCKFHYRGPKPAGQVVTTQQKTMTSKNCPYVKGKHDPVDSQNEAQMLDVKLAKEVCYKATVTLGNGQLKDLRQAMIWDYTLFTDQFKYADGSDNPNFRLQSDKIHVLDIHKDIAYLVTRP